MPYLIIPTETGKIRPAGRLEIDYNSGLTQGLCHFFVCDGTGMTDLVSGKRYAATGGSGRIGAFGPAWVSGGVGTRIVGPTGAIAQRVGNYRTGSGVTAFVSGVFTTANTSAVAISCTFQTSGGGWTLKSEQYNNTNNVGFGSYGVGLDYNSTIATPAGSSIMSIRMSANANTYYKVNSLPITSTANASPGNTGNQITLGAAIRNSAYIDAINSGDYLYWGAIYNVDVAEGLRTALHNGPYGSLVKRANARIYSFPSATAPSTWKPAWAYRINHVIGSGIR